MHACIYKTYICLAPRMPSAKPTSKIDGLVGWHARSHACH